MTVVNYLKIINKIDIYRQFNFKQTPGSGIIEIILEILTSKTLVTSYAFVICLLPAKFSIFNSLNSPVSTCQTDFN